MADAQYKSSYEVPSPNAIDGEIQFLENVLCSIDQLLAGAKHISFDIGLVNGTLVDARGRLSKCMEVVTRKDTDFEKEEPSLGIQTDATLAKRIATRQPLCGEYYHLVLAYGTVDTITTVLKPCLAREDYSNTDDFRFIFGNYFKSKIKAQAACIEANKMLRKVADAKPIEEMREY